MSRREPISTTRHGARAVMRLAKSRSCARLAEFGLNLKSTDMRGIFQATICAHSGEVSISGRGHILSSVVGLREPISNTRHGARAGMRLTKSRSCAGVAAFGLNLESTGMRGIFQATICAHSGEVSVSRNGYILSSVVGLREPISNTRHGARAVMRLAKSRSCARLAEFGLDLKSTGIRGIF